MICRESNVTSIHKDYLRINTLLLPGRVGMDTRIQIITVKATVVFVSMGMQHISHLLLTSQHATHAILTAMSALEEPATNAFPA